MADPKGRNDLAPRVDSKQFFTYQDFSGGERGDKSARLAEPNTFHAKNMLVYDDGTIGPRPGLKQYELTGVQNGAITSLKGVGDGVNSAHYTQANRLHHFDSDKMIDPAVGVYSGVFAEEPEPSDAVFGPGFLNIRGVYVYYSVQGDANYSANVQTRVLAALPEGDGGRTLFIYLDSLYVAGVENRVIYSAPGDFDSFPPGNFFDVGYDGVITDLFDMHNGLLLRGRDHRWWLLTGTPVSGTLRTVALDGGTSYGFGAGHTLLADKEEVWFLNDTEYGSWPCVFDGARVDNDSLKHLRWVGGEDIKGGCVLSAFSDLMWISRDTHRCLVRHKGIWTFHEYEVDVCEYTDSVAGSGNWYMTSVDGTVSTQPQFFHSKWGVARPSFTSDFIGSPGDGSDTPIDAWVEFHEEWGEEADKLRPKGVMVEFTRYDTGTEATNHFEIDVALLARYGQPGSGSTATVAWDQAGSASTTDGVRDRFIYRPDGVAPASGLQVRIRDIRGIKIERVVMDADVITGLDRY